MNAGDPHMRAAAQLMRRIAPLPPDTQRQRRVRLRMGAPAMRRRPAFVLVSRPAVALAVLLASVAGASAMMGGGWQYARSHITWLALSSPAPHAAKAKLAAKARPAATAKANANAVVAATAPVEAAVPVIEAAPVVTATEEPAPVPAPTSERRHRRVETRHRVTAERSPEAAAPVATA